jgi:hypothetical protein
VAQLQQSLEEATTAPHLSTEASHEPLLAAHERIRKLTEALERTQTESADKYDKLASRFETLSRQKLAAAEQTPHEETPKSVPAELQEAQDRLAQTTEQAKAQAQQLLDLQRVVETEKERVRHLEAGATPAENQVTELQKKCTAAEAQASRDADQIRAQTAQIKQLEEKLREEERQAAKTQREAEEGERESLQQRVRVLQAQVATGDTPVRQQLTALEAQRDRLQAECALHRQHAAAGDSIYDRASAVGIHRLRKLLEDSSQSEPAALDEHMHRFQILIDWSARWFGRQFVRVLLQSDQRVQVAEWAKQAARDLIRETQEGPSQDLYGLPQWAGDNPVLLGQLALCVAASTAERLVAAIPEPFRAAMQAALAPYVVPAVAVTPPSGTALLPASPRTTPKLTPTRRTAPAGTAPIPPPILAQSTTWPDIAENPEPSVVPPLQPPKNHPEPFALDRLVDVKQDLLSVSHQLAELQDVLGRPITAQRLREGANISEQAREEAMVDRWNYIRRPPPERSTPVHWVRVGELLDEQSERELRDRTTEQLVDVSTNLRILEHKRRR